MNNTTVAIILALIIGGVAGYIGAGYQYSAQLDEARNAFPTTPSMEAVSGTIQSISGNTITLQTESSINPFEKFPKVRTVTVTDATTIVRSEVLDPAVFQKKMDAYQAAAEKASSNASSSPAVFPTPPTPTIETPITVSELAVGDLVVAEAGTDIKTSTSFDAVKIILVNSGAPGGLPVGDNVPPPPKP